MGSLAGLSTQDVIDRVLVDSVAGHADVRAEMAAAQSAAFAGTQPRLLELARVRTAMLLGCDAEVAHRTPGAEVDDDTLSRLAAWPTDDRFTDADRAVLAMTEHYLIDVASLDDATVEAVRVHLGDEGLTSFVHALLFVEQRIRLRLMWDRLDLAAPTAGDAAPATGGAPPTARPTGTLEED